MPSDSSQKRIGMTAIPDTTETWSMRPKNVAAKEARSKGAPMSPIVGMTRGTRPDRLHQAAQQQRVEGQHEAATPGRCFHPKLAVISQHSFPQIACTINCHDWATPHYPTIRIAHVVPLMTVTVCRNATPDCASSPPAVSWSMPLAGRLCLQQNTAAPCGMGISIGPWTFGCSPR